MGSLNVPALLEAAEAGFLSRTTVNMTSSQTEYRSYLVRLWRSSDNEPWHVMTEQIGSNERLMFANLESLLDFLQSGQSKSVVEPKPSLSDVDDANPR